MTWNQRVSARSGSRGPAQHRPGRSYPWDPGSQGWCPGRRGPRPSTPSCLKMGCPGPGAGRVNPRSIPGRVSQPAHLCHTGQKRIPCVGGQSRPPSQRTEKRALVKVVPGGQHPLGPCYMKSNWCGQAEVGCGSVAGAGRPPGAARRQDRGPGRRPVRTGVSVGSSWGRGSSAGSWARGGSCWAPAWTQLEHLQVPLLVRSPAGSMQGKAEGTVGPHPPTRRGLRAPRVTLSFTDGETEAQTGSGQGHSGRARLAPQQESPECLIFPPGAGPGPLRSVCWSPSPMSPGASDTSVACARLAQACRQSLAGLRCLCPGARPQSTGGGCPAESRRPRARRKGREGRGKGNDG